MQSRVRAECGMWLVGAIVQCASACVFVRVMCACKACVLFCSVVSCTSVDGVLWGAQVRLHADECGHVARVRRRHLLHRRRREHLSRPARPLVPAGRVRAPLLGHPDARRLVRLGGQYAIAMPSTTVVHCIALYCSSRSLSRRTASFYMAFKHIREAARNANEKLLRYGARTLSYAYSDFCSSALHTHTRTCAYARARSALGLGPECERGAPRGRHGHRGRPHRRRLHDHHALDRHALRRLHRVRAIAYAYACIHSTCHTVPLSE